MLDFILMTSPSLIESQIQHTELKTESATLGAEFSCLWPHR